MQYGYDQLNAGIQSHCLRFIYSSSSCLYESDRGIRIQSDPGLERGQGRPLPNEIPRRIRMILICQASTWHSTLGYNSSAAI